MAIIDVDTTFISDDKSDFDEMAIMIHTMAGLLARRQISGWHLKSTATFDNDVTTVWSNDIVDVGAHTEDGIHHYWIKDAK